MQREPLVPHDPAQSLAAGGIVALGAKLPAEERTTAVSARAYPHPAIDGKVIVRLEPDAVAEGTDAEMAAFGFGAPKVSASLGTVRYRTLGFPAWGLVNAPKQGKVALGVMEDVRKAKRLVAAKPGHAKDAFEKIAKTLQKSAPQLLPSFWEEVGRVVADQASSSMAAQCFERARQAERAFKLKIDPDDADAVFVEFALLGALSAKTLSQYAKDLAKSAGGAQAYKRFRAIAVKRALGGMPPWSGMGKDIRSLAEAADLDVDKEDETLVAELLEAPAIGKAPKEFWTTYHDTLLRLAKGSAQVRTRLRALWPEPRGGEREARDEFRATWVEILDEVGALADLPDDGLGTWVSRLVLYAGASDRVKALLRELAPRLASQPIAIVTPRSRWGTDLHLDLAELALELGIPLAAPENDDFFPESMTCDPVRVAAHPVYGKKLAEAVASMIGESEHEHRMRGKKGFETARRMWIAEQLDTLAKDPLTCTSEGLDTLEAKTTAETFLPFQELWERLRTLDLAPALAAQLRTGLADEFGWPAYEQAFAKLAGSGDIRLGGAFPVLVLFTASKAIAVDRTGVIAEHDLVYKNKEHTVENVAYLDGQFVVELEPVKGWGNTCYWSSAPKQRFELKGSIDGFPTATTLADGRVTMSGEKAFRAGDAELDSGQYYTDGTRFWVRDWRTSRTELKEVDPTKGTKVGVGLPEFFTKPWPEQAGKWELDLYHSSLMKAPDGLASSPLGVANGLSGVRIRSYDRDDDTTVTQAERIDGVTADLGSYDALVVFPGDPKPRTLDADNDTSARFGGKSGPTIKLGDGTNEVRLNLDDWAARGWGKVHIPQVVFWHYFTPRDEAGSKSLRAITTAQARTLLDTARGELAGDASGRAMPKTEAAARALGVSDPVLVRGIAGMAERAAELDVRREGIAAERAKENADPSGEGISGEGMKLRKVLAALHAGKPSKLKDIDVDPTRWLKNGRFLALESLLPFAEADERRKARDMLRALASTPFADDVSKLRVLSVSEPDDYNDPEESETVTIERDGGSTFAIHHDYGSSWALEYSTDGTFRAPKPWTVEESTKLEVAIGSEWARAFAALPDEPVPWEPAIATTLAEKAGLSVPEATLLYLGMPSGWGRDFLGKAKRDVVGLKMGEADAARTTFQDLDDDKKQALLAKAVPDDASLLRTPLAEGGYVERLAKVWKQKFGKRAKIPQDLIAAAKKDLELGNELGKYLPAFAGEDDVWFLKPDLRPLPELGGWRDDKGLTWSTASELATLIAWLFLQRPVGDAVRSGLADVVAALRKIVNDARVLWKLDDRWFDKDNPKGVALRDSLVQLVGGKSVDLPKDGDTECSIARDDGTIVLGVYDSSVSAAFRPAKLEGAAKKKVETLATAMMHAEDGVGNELKELRIAELLRSDGFGAFAERVRDTPVPTGGFEANPLASVPKLVAKVAKAHGISQEAAALYLQVLALAEPTERAVQTWNGWTAKQYKGFAAELAKKKLVVEGKRERAGRSIFVKGGYSKGDRKDLPMEDWKQSFYGVLERHVPAEPCHLLFARAWKRVEDGDGPA